MTPAVVLITQERQLLAQIHVVWAVKRENQSIRLTKHVIEIQAKGKSHDMTIKKVTKVLGPTVLPG